MNYRNCTLDELISLAEREGGNRLALEIISHYDDTEIPDFDAKLDDKYEEGNQGWDDAVDRMKQELDRL